MVTRHAVQVFHLGGRGSTHGENSQFAFEITLRDQYLFCGRWRRFDGEGVDGHGGFFLTVAVHLYLIVSVVVDVDEVGVVQVHDIVESDFLGIVVPWQFKLFTAQSHCSVDVVEAEIVVFTTLKYSGGQ